MSNQKDEIRMSMEQAVATVERGEALLRMFANEDFKDLILEGFLREEPARIANASTSPMHQAYQGEQDADTLASIKATGFLYNYLQQISRNAEMASQAIKADKEALSEIAEEEGI